MIMVNPMDLASSSIADGNIFYRVVEASDAVAMADVLEATAIAWDTYPVYPALEWAFIVTWSCVRRNGGADSERQTFQFVLTTDGVTVATFHNFAEVNTPDDMLVGLQAGGAFAGDALSPSFFLNQYNACPCGRWALQVHDVFTMPMSGIKACPGDCSYDEPEGCVDCMALCFAQDLEQDSPGECACMLTDSHVLAIPPYAITYGGSFSLSDVTFPDGVKRQDLVVVSTESGDDYACKFKVIVTMKSVSSEPSGIVDQIKISFGDVDKVNQYTRNLKYTQKKHQLIEKGPEQLDVTITYDLANEIYQFSDENLSVTVEGTPLGGFKAYSPECNWVVEYMPTADNDFIQVSMLGQPVSGLCGPLTAVSS